MRISNKCPNAQWDALVSKGAIRCCCVFQTDILVLSHHQLKISRYLLCFVKQIYGDISSTNILHPKFFNTSVHTAGRDLIFYHVMYQIVVTF